MIKNIKLILFFLVFIICSCASESYDNSDLIEAQHIQTIYFQLLENPKFYNDYPENWKIYNEFEINTAKRFYLESTQNENN